MNKTDILAACTALATHRQRAEFVINFARENKDKAELQTLVSQLCESGDYFEGLMGLLMAQCVKSPLLWKFVDHDAAYLSERAAFLSAKLLDDLERVLTSIDTGSVGPTLAAALIKGLAHRPSYATPTLTEAAFLERLLDMLQRDRLTEDQFCRLVINLRTETAMLQALSAVPWGEFRTKHWETLVTRFPQMVVDHVLKDAPTNKDYHVDTKAKWAACKALAHVQPLAVLDYVRRIHWYHLQSQTAVVDQLLALQPAATLTMLLNRPIEPGTDLVEHHYALLRLPAFCTAASQPDHTAAAVAVVERYVGHFLPQKPFTDPSLKLPSQLPLHAAWIHEVLLKTHTLAKEEGSSLSTVDGVADMLARLVPVRRTFEEGALLFYRQELPTGTLLTTRFLSLLSPGPLLNQLAEQARAAVLETNPPQAALLTEFCRYSTVAPQFTKAAQNKDAYERQRALTSLISALKHTGNPAHLPNLLAALTARLRNEQDQIRGSLLGSLADAVPSAWWSEEHHAALRAFLAYSLQAKGSSAASTTALHRLQSSLLKGALTCMVADVKYAEESTAVGPDAVSLDWPRIELVSSAEEQLARFAQSEQAGLLSFAVEFYEQLPARGVKSMMSLVKEALLSIEVLIQTRAGPKFSFGTHCPALTQRLVAWACEYDFAALQKKTAHPTDPLQVAGLYSLFTALSSLVGAIHRSAPKKGKSTLKTSSGSAYPAWAAPYQSVYEFWGRTTLDALAVLASTRATIRKAMLTDPSLQLPSAPVFKPVLRREALLPVALRVLDFNLDQVADDADAAVQMLQGSRLLIEDGESYLVWPKDASVPEYAVAERAAERVLALIKLQGKATDSSHDVQRAAGALQTLLNRAGRRYWERSVTLVAAVDLVLFDATYAGAWYKNTAQFWAMTPSNPSQALARCQRLLQDPKNHAALLNFNTADELFVWRDQAFYVQLQQLRKTTKATIDPEQFNRAAYYRYLPEQQQQLYALMVAPVVSAVFNLSEREESFSNSKISHAMCLFARLPGIALCELTDLVDRCEADSASALQTTDSAGEDSLAAAAQHSMIAQMADHLLGGVSRTPTFPGPLLAALVDKIGGPLGKATVRMLRPLMGYLSFARSNDVLMQVINHPKARVATLVAVAQLTAKLELPTLPQLYTALWNDMQAHRDVLLSCLSAAQLAAPHSADPAVRAMLEQAVTVAMDPPTAATVTTATTTGNKPLSDCSNAEYAVQHFAGSFSWGSTAVQPAEVDYYLSLFLRLTQAKGGSQQTWTNRTEIQRKAKTALSCLVSQRYTATAKATVKTEVLVSATADQRLAKFFAGDFLDPPSESVSPTALAQLALINPACEALFLETHAALTRAFLGTPTQALFGVLRFIPRIGVAQVHKPKAQQLMGKMLTSLTHFADGCTTGQGVAGQVPPLLLNHYLELLMARMDLCVDLTSWQRELPTLLEFLSAVPVMQQSQHAIVVQKWQGKDAAQLVEWLCSQAHADAIYRVQYQLLTMAVLKNDNDANLISKYLPQFFSAENDPAVVMAAYALIHRAATFPLS